jgi:hypothetical protein
MNWIGRIEVNIFFVYAKRMEDDVGKSKLAKI